MSTQICGLSQDRVVELHKLGVGCMTPEGRCRNLCADGKTICNQPLTNHPDGPVQEGN